MYGAPAKRFKVKRSAGFFSDRWARHSIGPRVAVTLKNIDVNLYWAMDYDGIHQYM